MKLELTFFIYYHMYTCVKISFTIICIPVKISLDLLLGQLVVSPETRKNMSFCFISQDSLPFSLSSFHPSLVRLPVTIVDCTLTSYLIIAKFPSEMETSVIGNLAISLPKTLNETALENSSIFPSIAALAMRHSLTIVAFIIVSIRKFLLSPAMLQKVLESSLKPLPFAGLMNAFTLNYPILPLTHVIVPLRR